VKKSIIVLSVVVFLIVTTYLIGVIILRLKLISTLSHQVMNPLNSKPTDTIAKIDSARLFTYAVKMSIVDRCSNEGLETKGCHNIINLCQMDLECYQMVRGYQQAYHPIDYYTQVFQKGAYTPTPQTYLKAALWYKESYPFKYRTKKGAQGKY
jgi:hypothetical protein